MVVRPLLSLRKAPCPAFHHLGWPWLGGPLLLRWLPLWVPDAYSKSSPPPRVALALHAPTQLTTIEVGPGSSTLFLFLLLSPLLFFLLSGRPARWNPKWFRSKVIILLLLPRQLLPWNGPKRSALSKFEDGTWVSLVRAPLTLPVLVVLALEPPLSSSYLMLLFYTADLLTFAIDNSTWWLKRVWFLL